MAYRFNHGGQLVGSGARRAPIHAQLTGTVSTGAAPAAATPEDREASLRKRVGELTAELGSLRALQGQVEDLRQAVDANKARMARLGALVGIPSGDAVDHDDIEDRLTTAVMQGQAFAGYLERLFAAARLVDTSTDNLDNTVKLLTGFVDTAVRTMALLEDIDLADHNDPMAELRARLNRLAELEAQHRAPPAPEPPEDKAKPAQAAGGKKRS